MNRTELAARVAELMARGARLQVTEEDRAEMAVALVLQRYEQDQAWRMCFDKHDPEYLRDNDGALQMLARHRMLADLARMRELYLTRPDLPEGWQYCPCHCGAIVPSDWKDMP